MCTGWPWRKIAKIAAAVVFVVLFASLALPIAFESCNPNEYTHVKECAQYHLPQFIFIETVRIVDAQNGLITAVATAILVWVTWRLVILEKDGANTTQAQLRAYVFVDSCKLNRNPDGQGPWEIHLILKNYGQTPAADVVIQTERDIRAEIGREDILEFSKDAQTNRASTVAPGKHYATRMPIAAGNIDWAATRAAGQRCYIWARVEYRDTFRRKRWTTIQMVHGFDDVLDFSFCEPGNDFR